jgi:hypothetical protein
VDENATVRWLKRRLKLGNPVSVYSQEGQQCISDLIAIKGKPFALRVTELLPDVAVVVECYGTYHNVLNDEGGIIDPKGFVLWIGHRVTIKAIAHDDPVAREWVLAQSRKAVGKDRRLLRPWMDDRGLEQVAQRAAQRVCAIAKGDIEDTDGPVRPEDLIDYAAVEAVAGYLSEHGRPVPAIIEQHLNAWESWYTQLTREFQARLRLYLGTRRIVEGYSPSLKQAFLGLSRARRRLIALAYWDRVRRLPSEVIAQDLQALDPHSRANPGSVDTDLFEARSALRRNVRDQFVALIDRILSCPGKVDHSATVLSELCQTYCSRRTQPPRVSAELPSALCDTLLSDISNTNVAAHNLCRQHLCAIGLAPQDYEFVVDIVRLLLAIHKSDCRGVEMICEEICYKGIPDPRERLFSLGVKMLGVSLHNV